MTLTCEEWVELCDLYNVIRQVSHITFNVVAERQRARNALNNLRREAPFNECRRFPWRKIYVNLSCSVYGTLFQNLLGALDYKDRETEKELRYGNNHKQDDKDQNSSSNSSIDDAKTAYRNNLKNIQNELCKKNELYDRIRFETKYNLQWCEGPCPREPGYVPPTKPEEPPKVQRTYGDLMAKLTDKGLTPSDFNVFTEADMAKGFACGRPVQKLGDTLKDKKIPVDIGNVYVFTAGEYTKCGQLGENVKGYIYRPISDFMGVETILVPTNVIKRDRISELEALVMRMEEEMEFLKQVRQEGNDLEEEGINSNWRSRRWFKSRLPSRSRSREISSGEMV